MNSSNISCCTCVLAAVLLTSQVKVLAQPPPDQVQQIAELMSQGPSGKAHQRYMHAKGIVCQGTFQASSEAAAISRAAHFQDDVVPVTVRFSDGAPDIAVADNSPDASPRGMAIRFATGRGTDIMAVSHNGFIVGTGEEFLALQKAIAATDPSKPHPWPIEDFLASHPRALKFVQDTETCAGKLCHRILLCKQRLRIRQREGEKQAGRYQIVPMEGGQYLVMSARKPSRRIF